MSGGTGLDAIDPRSLVATRDALHHAALLVSAIGRVFGERQPGFRHAALFWDRDRSALAGWPIESGRGAIRAALEFKTGAISVGARTVTLQGATGSEVLAQLRTAVADVGLDGERVVPRLPADLPPGPLLGDALFRIDTPAANALARWYALADGRLAETATAAGVPPPVPCWPDHFDLAVTVMVPAPAPPQAQVGLGFSPGDGTIPEPYFYVTPWPLAASRVADVPAPAGGRWQVEGWLGLALPASTILAPGNAAASVTAFLERGLEMGRDLVRAT